MFLAYTRKQDIPGASISSCWLSLYVLFVILKLIVKLLNFLNALSFGPIVILTFVTIQILMSPLLNVSAHNSTRCLCLGLQHSAA